MSSYQIILVKKNTSKVVQKNAFSFNGAATGHTVQNKKDKKNNFFSFFSFRFLETYTPFDKHIF